MLDISKPHSKLSGNSVKFDLGQKTVQIKILYQGFFKKHLFAPFGFSNGANNCSHEDLVYEVLYVDCYLPHLKIFWNGANNCPQEAYKMKACHSFVDGSQQF